MPPPPGKVWISDLLRSFLVYSWGEIAKAGDLLLNLVVVFEARRIKGVTPLRAADQLVTVIRVRRGKISALILIAYCRSPFLAEQCRGSNALIRSLALQFARCLYGCHVLLVHVRRACAGRYRS